jgi:hypothetical protein
MEKYTNIIEWAYNLSVGTILIPVIVAIFRWKYFNFPLKMVAINYLRGLILGSLSLYYAKIGHSQQLLYSLGTCIDIILVFLTAQYVLNFRKDLKLILTFFCIIFLGLMINDYITTNALFSSYLLNAETIFVIIVSILMLRKVALTYKSNTYKRSLIWILSAVLISNLFSILLQTLMEKMSAYSNDLMQLSWYLSSPLFMVITNLMVAYGFYIIRNKVREA